MKFSGSEGSRNAIESLKNHCKGYCFQSCPASSRSLEFIEFFSAAARRIAPFSAEEEEPKILRHLPSRSFPVRDTPIPGGTVSIR